MATLSPFVAEVLQQTRVRSSGATPSDAERRAREYIAQPSNDDTESGSMRNRALFSGDGSGGNNGTEQENYRDKIALVVRAYDAYRQVNRVRNTASWIGTGSSGLLMAARIASGLYYRTGPSAAAAAAADGSWLSAVTSTVGTIGRWAHYIGGGGNTCNTQSNWNRLYWVGIGAAVGIAVYSEARWWLSDHSFARDSLEVAQDAARHIQQIDENGDSSNNSVNDGSSSSSGSGRHRRRRHHKTRGLTGTDVEPDANDKERITAKEQTEQGAQGGQEVPVEATSVTNSTTDANGNSNNSSSSSGPLIDGNDEGNDDAATGGGGDGGEDDNNDENDAKSDATGNDATDTDGNSGGKEKKDYKNGGDVNDADQTDPENSEKPSSSGRRRRRRRKTMQ